MGRMGEVLRGDQHEAIRSLRDKIKDKEQTTKNKHNNTSEEQTQRTTRTQNTITNKGKASSRNKTKEQTARTIIQNTGEEQRTSSNTKNKFMNKNNEQGTNNTNNNKEQMASGKTKNEYQELNYVFLCWWLVMFLVLLVMIVIVFGFSCFFGLHVVMCALLSVFVLFFIIPLVCVL